MRTCNKKNASQHHGDPQERHLLLLHSGLWRRWAGMAMALTLVSAIEVGRHWNWALRLSQQQQQQEQQQQQPPPGAETPFSADATAEHPISVTVEGTFDLPAGALHPPTTATGGSATAASPSSPPSKMSIQTIALIGERNSGTTWMLQELRRCYNRSFTVLNHLTRHKHYFQYDDGGVRMQHNRTLVVAEFRDPHQWVLAMVEKPRRTTAHRHLDWRTFVTKPWTTDRAPSDAPFANATGPVCQERFYYHEVVSCVHRPPLDEYVVEKSANRRREQSVPIYELRRDGSGLPYDSVVELRADKIRNHVLEVKNYTSFVEEVVVVRYEDLLKEGTGPLHRRISSITGVAPHCDVTPPQPQRPGRTLPDGFHEWMDQHVDWDAEALVGYYREH